MNEAGSRNARAQRERGTTLLLFPSAVLVVMLLAAIAVDLSVVHLGRRELIRVAAQAADDGASMIDQGAVRSGSGVVIDLQRATEVVQFEMTTADLTGELSGTPTVRLGERPGTIVVNATVHIDHIFGGVVPGTPRYETVTIEVTGELLEL